ncbi:TetR/AcrR family transcriptional regulator [Pararoseomonas indoligenes]|uniref:TetR/AcrR family transcriptional regulator n=1 Tax=Roseomonas indoligenes TaxID=2820811 RepID=A0A940S7I5_9PROT|nr:TetR/AcrR family transcriptional regulator [Pararoseomonas indoligenes]MBP0495089.1 TetR/AcrR family transcriptional regulator [Pararoseomonas indoligenes]
MTANKSSPSNTPRGDATRQRVLEAAERLMREGSAEFSMRDLAAAAGVSFATPFNQFGSKAAIMQALSAQRIDAMAARLAAAAPAGDASDRVLAAVDIAVAVMLEQPAVSRAVMGSLGTQGPEPGQVSARSRALWALALGKGEGLAPALADLACRTLPDQLAIAFRGVLSFWTAGEIGDEALAPRARAGAATALLGFVEDGRRDGLIRLLRA